MKYKYKTDVKPAYAASSSSKYAKNEVEEEGAKEGVQEYQEEAKKDDQSAEEDAKEEDHKPELEQLKTDLQKQKALHESYKKRQAKERQQWDTERSLLQEANNTAINEKDMVTGKNKDMRELYLLLIKKLSDAYTNKNSEIALPTTATSKFQFLENQDAWVDILDANAVSMLQNLSAESSTAQYTIGQHTYEASLTNLISDYAIQKNLSTNAMRRVRQTPTTLTQEDMDSHYRKTLLFGNSFIPVVNAEIVQWMQDYNQNEGASEEPCMELSELAQLFSSFGSKFNYKVSDRKTCKTELYVKPLAMWQFLKMAEARNYTHMRLVLHGGTKEEYKAIKGDPFGFNMRFAGKNGRAAGNGIYFGLSDHITVSYNKMGKNGTGVMGILLTDETLAGVGSMTAYNLPPAGNTSAYQQVGYETNAIAVHEMGLILVLGLVVAV